jgi:hypothetical protein
MALASLQRRTARLEKVFAVDTVAHYPPLTDAEMTALAERMANGEKCTAVETARVARRCPFTYSGEDGGLVVHAYKGEVTAMRFSAVEMLL